MVLETTKESGAYVLGFRIDPYEKMKDIVQEIHSLYQVYQASPIFGVEYDLDDQVECYNYYSRIVACSLVAYTPSDPSMIYSYCSPSINIKFASPLPFVFIFVSAA